MQKVEISSKQTEITPDPNLSNKNSSTNTFDEPLIRMSSRQLLPNNILENKNSSDNEGYDVLNPLRKDDPFSLCLKSHKPYIERRREHRQRKNREEYERFTKDPQLRPLLRN